MRAKFIQSEAVAERIYTYWFDSLKPFSYIAGQYTEVYLPHNKPDSRGEKRWFTLSSSPTEKYFSITTKIPTGTKSSFKQALENLKAGDIINFSEPMGDFILPINTKIPIVFIAGGVGITPVRSIIKNLLDTNQTRNISIFYTVSKSNEFIYKDLLTSFTAKTYFYATNKSIDINDILNKTDQVQESLYFISGPEKMVEDVKTELLKSGIDSQKIVADSYKGFNPNKLFG